MTATPLIHTARSLLGLLERHYIKPSDPLPGGVFLTEVPAPNASRRADALYMGFTRSRGTAINVFEVKVTRADWLTELADPTKAEAWFNHCHKFWVVCPRGVVKLGELPDGWGLMHPGKSKVRMDIEVKAETHEAEITLEVLQEIAKKLDLQRAAAGRQARNDYEQQVRDEVSKRMERDRKETTKYADEREETATKALQKLSELTGLRFDTTWGGRYSALEESADVIKTYCLGHVERQRILKRATTQLRGLQQQITEALVTLAED